MNIDLLTPNVSLFLCTAAVATLVYVLTRLDKQWHMKYLPLTAAISLLVTFLIERLISYYLDDSLPGALFFMIFPTVLAVWLFIVVFAHKVRLRVFAFSMVVVNLLFTLAMINGYYRFYPNLYSVFNRNNARQLATSQDVSIKFSLRTKAPNRQSIESSLQDVHKNTTGSVYSIDIPGTVSKFKTRGAYAYVPAIASSPAKVNLPVLVLSTGFPGLPANWLGSGLQATMDEFASHHGGISPLVIMVDNTGSLTNDTECVDSPRGNAETYLSTDVPNYIKSHFEVANGPGHWAIGGLSMGGMCSIMLALRHTDVYHYFLDFGGEIGPEVGSQQKTISELFRGSETAWAEHQPSQLLEQHNYSDMGGFFSVGKEDSLKVTAATRQLYQQSKAAGIESIYETIGGNHTFAVWQQSFKDALPWLSNRLDATTCSAACY
ncbi:MAG: alpha/beta hydrolase-fold protein [Candidatus Saccharimonadales bacterium]